MNPRTCCALALATGVLTLSVASSASASIDDADIDWSFQLFDHPDGNQSPPLYFLRLDGLQGDPNKEYTFTANPNVTGGVMRMDVDVDPVNGVVIWIHGKAYGGEDAGGTYGTEQGLFDIDFVYRRNTTTNGQTAPAGDSPNYKTQPKSTLNAGTISYIASSGTWTDTKTSYNMTDYAPNSNASFYFEFGDHRLPNDQAPGWEGWGWLNHDGINPNQYPNYHEYASDWLFTAVPILIPSEGESPIPEPGSVFVWTALCGIGALGGVRVRCHR